jgi:dsDNA-specific endonuclease/ATPase MutS2
MLTATELEYIGNILRAIKNLKGFLIRCKNIDVGIAYYADELDDLSDIRMEIENSVRDGYINDYASNVLKDIRRNISILEDRIKSKAEAMLGINKEIYSENFISDRGGHICLPVKKEYKSKISGSVIDKSRTGETLFIEPTSIAKINEELQKLKIEENNEEIRILYTLSVIVSDAFSIFEKNRKTIEHLDFAFAKGKLSIELNAISPKINTKGYIQIKQGRHPLLDKDICVPLDFEIDNKTKGILITGPNTGGKTVCIKTIGLLSIMAQCGLHIPCTEADIYINTGVLCDIGDGQNISENLSTFSGHITNILDILEKANNESIVILDELGSGTDPTEGMGIAIAILDELRKKNCIFIVTTHYPEVKSYGDKTEGIINARMAFDTENLKPLYKLEIGKSGESCALYIASKLGMSEDMIKKAYKVAYQKEDIEELGITFTKNEVTFKKNKKLVKVEKKQEYKEISKTALSFNIGDCVIVLPEGKLGVVCKKANEKGEILVQKQQKQKELINHKRLKLKIPAIKLYPEDYDFSIIFDTVSNRKKRHQMTKKHQTNIQIELEE